MPSGRANWDTFVDGESVELDSARFSKLVTSLLTLSSGGITLLHAVKDLGGFLLWLDAVVVVLLISVWANHGAVATSDSHEEGVTFGLESGWGDLLTISVSVSSFASLLWSIEVEFAGGDLLLDVGWEVVVKGEEGLDIVVSLDGESVDGEDLLNTGVFGAALGESTDDE